MTDLPRHPGDLLRLAIKDLQLCQRSQGYKIDMAIWHRLQPDGLCHVCLAGAVVAKSLQQPIGAYEQNIGLHNTMCMFAIDHFRKGRVYAGLQSLSLGCPSHYPFKVDVPDYDKNRRGFFRALRTLAKTLDTEYPNHNLPPLITKLTTPRPSPTAFSFTDFLFSFVAPVCLIVATATLTHDGYAPRFTKGVFPISAS